jgi:hypothetical protein
LCTVVKSVECHMGSKYCYKLLLYL